MFLREVYAAYHEEARGSGRMSRGTAAHVFAAASQAWMELPAGVQEQYARKAAREADANTQRLNADLEHNQQAFILHKKSDFPWRSKPGECHAF